MGQFDLMANYQQGIIGTNVKLLRESIGLSQHDFSTLVDISKRSIANIESGRSNIDLNQINKLLSFYLMYSINDLSDKDLKVYPDIKEKLIAIHRKEKPDLINLLSKTPHIVYAVKYKLLTSDFLKAPKEINEIKNFFLEKYGWDFIGSSISNALKRMPNLIEIKPHANKKNTNVYVKKHQASYIK